MEQPVTQSSGSRIGVLLGEVPKELSKSFGANRKGGYIIGVNTGFPAEKTGLVVGDIVTDLNFMPVTDTASIRAILDNIKPGTQVILGVWNKGKTRYVYATTVARE